VLTAPKRRRRPELHRENRVDLKSTETEISKGLASGAGLFNQRFNVGLRALASLARYAAAKTLLRWAAPYATFTSTFASTPASSTRS
jgi:hypothetical protein